jgi:hypothetical protein
VVDWVGIGVTLILGAVGLYYANSVRRKTRAEVETSVAQKRFDAYARLWAATKAASPTRKSPLTAVERTDLFDKMTDWYYAEGNGMLLTEQTRNIYLRAKRNLNCPGEELVPDSLAQRVASEGDTLRGQASIDQLSLLRTSMRADLHINTEPYDQELSHDDVAFLRAAKVDLDTLPWRRALERHAAEPPAPTREG